MSTTTECQVVSPATLDDVARLIGHTSLLEIGYTFDGQPYRLFAKNEQENMTGSVKDRMAEHMLRRAYDSGELHPGDTIVEATSGNTGISLAAIGRALGHAVRIYMPAHMSRERVLLMESLGAEIVSVSKADGGFLRCLELAEEYARQHDRVFLPRQCESPLNSDSHYFSTGPEIEAQLAALGLRADAFAAGVGTGGTIMGIGRYLRRAGAAVKVHPIMPANPPVMKDGVKAGGHRIQGVTDDLGPTVINLAELDEMVKVWDGDSILMAQALARELGLGVGISSGTNFLGAALVAERLGPNAVVATVFPDSNKKYVSTDLFCEEPSRDDYLTARIELRGFRVIPGGRIGG